MSAWGTPLPALSNINHEAERLEARGFDVHTVRVVLNGQHGGWDVTIEATDEDLDNYSWTYTARPRYGELEPVAVQLPI